MIQTINIQLIFPFLQTQEPFDWTDTDFLTIYDGPNDQSTQIETLSGNLGSFGISSYGNSFYVIFESDDSDQQNSS